MIISTTKKKNKGFILFLDCKIDDDEIGGETKVVVEQVDRWRQFR